MAEPEIRFYGITDVGRRRDHNEDSYYFSESEHYAIIADGMGGRHYGEVAANMTVQVIREKFETFFPFSIREMRRTDQGNCTDMVVCLLDDWIRDANRAVWDKGQKEEQFREMGTTLAMVYTLPNTVVVAHIGDSRVYHLHGERLRQVTSDHSFVNSQIATVTMPVPITPMVRDTSGPNAATNPPKTIPPAGKKPQAISYTPKTRPRISSSTRV